MPEQAPTLRDMIQEANAKGQNYRQLAARAIDPESGETASYSLINNIALGKVDRMPYDYHLRGIAVALKVPYERVRMAAIQQWVPPEPGATAADIPDDRKAQILAAIEQLDASADLVERLVKGEQAGTEAERGGAPAA